MLHQVALKQSWIPCTWPEGDLFALRFYLTHRVIYFLYILNLSRISFGFLQI
jgi:hypothetical protein